MKICYKPKIKLIGQNLFYYYLKSFLYSEGVFFIITLK